MKRWQYLLFSTVLAVVVLAVGTSSYLAIVRQERLEALERAEKDAEIYLDELRQAREQLREAEERLEALEDMLLNLHQMQQIAERPETPAAASRGGRQLTLTTMPLTTPSGYTAERLDRALASTGLAGLGQAFYGAEKDNGINALVLAAICAHESGWGTSRLARDKNNLAGLGAYDCSPGKAMCFDSREECVFYLARLLRDKPGDSLAEIGIWYASDPYWAAKVAGCMKLIVGAGVTP